MGNWQPSRSNSITSTLLCPIPPCIVSTHQLNVFQPMHTKNKKNESKTDIPHEKPTKNNVKIIN